jgi:hypothetical protein
MTWLQPIFPQYLLKSGHNESRLAYDSTSSNIQIINDHS